MEVKLTTFLISIVLIGFFMTIFMVISNQLDEHYEPGNYINDSNTIDWENYNKINALYNDTVSTKGNVSRAASGGFVANTIDFFTGGVKVFLTTLDSTKYMNDIVDSATQEADLGGQAELIKTTALVIVAILIVIGVFVAILVRAKGGGL